MLYTVTKMIANYSSSMYFLNAEKERHTTKARNPSNPFSSSVRASNAE